MLAVADINVVPIPGLGQDHVGGGHSVPGVYHDPGIETQHPRHLLLCKSYQWWCWGGGGGPCDFSVRPSPFGIDFGTSDSGLTI